MEKQATTKNHNQTPQKPIQFSQTPKYKEKYQTTWPEKKPTQPNPNPNYHPLTMILIILAIVLVTLTFLFFKLKDNNTTQSESNSGSQTGLPSKTESNTDIQSQSESQLEEGDIDIDTDDAQIHILYGSQKGTAKSYAQTIQSQTMDKLGMKVFLDVVRLMLVFYMSFG